MTPAVGTASQLLVLLLSAAFVAAQDTGVTRWNDLFAKGYKSEIEPNRYLAETIKGRTPGSALDIGMGQGRNALLLAAEGWAVTGFDLSDVAVGRAVERAKQRGLTLNAVVGNVDTFDFGENRWDLVTGIYIHGLLTRNADKVVRSLKPGGVLVVEGLHREALVDAGYRTNELPTLFSALTILRYEDAIGSPDTAWTDLKQFRYVRLSARKD
jgi:2-polyprenyl-3-methyl-5-hydroxy-6-metoxy-1,4-benzoquinol methylase